MKRAKESLVKVESKMHVEVIKRNLIESERLQTLGKRFVFKLVQSKSFKTAMLFSDVLFKPENKLCCLKKKKLK